MGKGEKANGRPVDPSEASFTTLSQLAVNMSITCERCKQIRQVESSQFHGDASARLCTACKNAVVRKVTGTASYKNAIAVKTEMRILENLAASGQDTRDEAKALAAKLWACNRQMFQTVMRAVSAGAAGDGEGESEPAGELEGEPAGVGS